MATRRPPTDDMRNSRARANAYVKMRNADTATHATTTATETAAFAAREEAHRTTRVATESDLASGRRNRAIVGQVASTATPSSDSGLIMTTIFVMAGLIVVYIFVSKPNSTGFLGSLGNGIHTLTSNTPLFTATAK